MLSCLSRHSRAASKTGKYQITNKYGQVTWAETPALHLIGSKMLFVVCPGEEALIGFVKAWANIPSEGGVFRYHR